MKNKKIKLISAILIAMFIIGILPKNINIAATRNLISVGTGNYAITVDTTTTVNDIIKVLGEPKLTTPSAFGGHAYTFYTDDNYSNYLYIETTANDVTVRKCGCSTKCKNPPNWRCKWRWRNKCDRCSKNNSTCKKENITMVKSQIRNSRSCYTKIN